MKRKLTVEGFNSGAKYKAPEASTIRLKGQWLRKLGFPAGAKVELTAISPGVLEIRLCGVAPTCPEFAITAHRLDHAIALDEARKAGGR